MTLPRLPKRRCEWQGIRSGGRLSGGRRWRARLFGPMLRAIRHCSGHPPTHELMSHKREPLRSASPRSTPGGPVARGAIDRRPNDEPTPRQPCQNPALAARSSRRLRTGRLPLRHRAVSPGNWNATTSLRCNASRARTHMISMAYKLSAAHVIIGKDAPRKLSRNDAWRNALAGADGGVAQSPMIQYVVLIAPVAPKCRLRRRSFRVTREFKSVTKQENRIHS